jgi:hypothetical protein
MRVACKEKYKPVFRGIERLKLPCAWQNKLKALVFQNRHIAKRDGACYENGQPKHRPCPKCSRSRPWSWTFNNCHPVWDVICCWYPCPCLEFFILSRHYSQLFFSFLATESATNLGPWTAPRKETWPWKILTRKDSQGTRKVLGWKARDRWRASRTAHLRREANRRPTCLVMATRILKPCQEKFRMQQT